MTSGESRFESDPGELVGEVDVLPEGWAVDAPDPDTPADVARLTELLRDHERAGRGWAGADRDDVLVEVSDHGLRTRENVVVRDPAGRIRAWGSVHDRASGRMLLVHVVGRDLDDRLGRACCVVLVRWAVGQARRVGRARGLAVQQIDTGAFPGDERQQRWLAEAGFERVRTWWQMSRPVTADEAGLVPDPARWERDGLVVRLVEGETDLRTVHDVLEAAFTDHFNSKPETFEEFLGRLREDPGHRWDHWWLAEVDGQPAGALVGSQLGGTGSGSTGSGSTGSGSTGSGSTGSGSTGSGSTGSGSTGSYVDYIGVVEAARGRGAAKGLLRTIIADAATRGRDRVGLEVDADSPTGADGLYRSMGWETAYVTESWHLDVSVGPAAGDRPSIER